MPVIVDGTPANDYHVATEAAEVIQATQGYDYVRGFDISQDSIDISPWILDGVERDRLDQYVKLVFWGGHSVLVFDPVGAGDSDQAKLLTLLDVDLSDYRSILELLDAGIVSWGGAEPQQETLLSGTDANDVYTATADADVIEVSGGYDTVEGFDVTQDTINVSPWLPEGIGFDNAYQYLKLGFWNGNTVLAVDPDGPGEQNISHVLTVEGVDFQDGGDIQVLIRQGIVTGFERPEESAASPDQPHIINGTDDSEPYIGTGAADMFVVSKGYDYFQAFNPEQDSINLAAWLPEDINEETIDQYLIVGFWNGNTILAFDPDGIGQGEYATQGITLEGVDFSDYGGVQGLMDAGILTGIQPDPDQYFSHYSATQIEDRTMRLTVFPSPGLGPVMEYQWDFGDGGMATTTSNTVDYTYPIIDGRAQDFTVQVSASATSGRVIARLPVRVHVELKRITVIGDSISIGFGGQRSYRYDVWQRLAQNTDYAFDFVGTRKTLDAGVVCDTGRCPDLTVAGGIPRVIPFDPEHESVSGYTAQWMAQYLPGWTNLPPYQNGLDVALIHLGTNGIFKQYPLENIIASLQDVIDVLKNRFPGIKILIAKITPLASSPPYPENIRALNDLIGSFADQPDVKVVDMYSDYPISYHFDGAHPGPEGENEMGKRWYQAIIDTLD